MRIAIIQTHPIQHFCPQFASYAKLPGIDIKVFFESDKGLNAYFDKDFKKEVNWTGIDLSGFEHLFLKEQGLEDELNHYQPDAIVVYGYFEPIQKRAYSYAIKHQIKLLYISDSEHHQKRPYLKQLLKQVTLKRFFSSINYCLSVGDSNESVYRNYGVTDDRIIRMFFPINVLFYNKLIEEKQTISIKVRNQFGIPDNHMVLSTIGKLVTWKRQRDLIEATKLLEKRGIKCTTLIIGSGEDEAQLKEMSLSLTTNKVIVTGFVQPEIMAHYLCATDIYIHPAEIEPHSLAISEAIYCGCPVVLSDRCGSYGPTDDVQPGRNGFVYPVGNIEKMVDCVCRLGQDHTQWAVFSEKSTQLSRHHQSLAHGEALMAAVNLMNNKIIGKTRSSSPKSV